MRVAIHVFTIGSIVAFTPNAHAYSNPADFDRPVDVGGGGGRHFTGAPGDGYRCSVCHLDAGEAALEIEGLPDEFVPGSTYDIFLSWEGPRTGIALELALREGGAAGEIELIEPGICVDMTEGARAQTIGSRTVVVVDACGAQTLAFRWTAPDSPEAWLYYGLVEGDVSGDPLGDRTFSDVVPLRADGAPTPSVEVGATCNASGKTPKSSLALILLGIAVMSVWRRR